MALIECVKCNGKVSTRVPRCPHCGEIQPRAKSARPVSSSGPENLGWAKTWAIVSGCCLVASFLIPIPIPQYNGYGALWTWDIVAAAPVMWSIVIVAPPIAGLAIVAAVAFAPPRRVPLLMACIGAPVVGLTLLMLLLQGSSIDEDLNLRIPLPLLAAALAVSGAFGIAAGNHIRKKHPGHLWPRLLMGICGILVTVFFLIPLGGPPMLVKFFAASGWKESWPVTLGLMICFGYGIAGIAAFRKVANPERAWRVIGILARVTFVLFPLSFLLLGYFNAHENYRTFQHMAPAALILLKIFLSVYGLLILPWAGVAATVIGTLKQDVPSAPPIPASVEA